jgi:branched-chain amino acid transport system permease protein
MAAAASLALAWPWIPDHMIGMLGNIGLYAIVAAGLVVLTGVAGMTSFGQAALVGLGAYATAWFCTAQLPLLTAVNPALLPWIGLALGLVLSLGVAWLLGVATASLSGHYLPLCTIAWGLSLYYLFGNLEFLGGHTGLTGIPALRIGEWSLASPRSFGALIWVVLAIALWGLHNLLDSREGRGIRALKSGNVLAESVGIDTARQRRRAFILAALLAAISGWLYAHFQRFVNPTPFNLNIGIEYLFMAVVGGSGHLWGAVLGATLITLLKEQLQDVLPALFGTSGNFEAIVFGFLMIVVLQRFSQGLWPTIARFVNGYLKADPQRIPVLSQPESKVGFRQGELLVEAHGVTKRFGGLTANSDVSLNLLAGEVHALIGPNGAGKSTFFNIISGVDEPSEGIVRIHGKAMQGQPPREFARSGVGRTFQHVRLLGNRSVLENVALGTYRRGNRGWLAAMARMDRAEEAMLLTEARWQLQRCGLAEHATEDAGSLPLGKQRILEIARALAGQPTSLLLDEPAAGLRRLEKQALAKLLVQLRTEGVGILIIEHDMEFVMNLADRITVLNFGTVIASGTPEAIQTNERVLAAYLGGDSDSVADEAARPREEMLDRAVGVAA